MHIYIYIYICIYIYTCIYIYIYLLLLLRPASGIMMCLKRLRLSLTAFSVQEVLITFPRKRPLTDIPAHPWFILAVAPCLSIRCGAGAKTSEKLSLVGGSVWNPRGPSHQSTSARPSLGSGSAEKRACCGALPGGMGLRPHSPPLARCCGATANVLQALQLEARILTKCSETPAAPEKPG